MSDTPSTPSPTPSSSDDQPAHVSPYVLPQGSEPYDMEKANRFAMISFLVFAGSALPIGGMIWLLLK
jgi:hypothetical protein